MATSDKLMIISIIVNCIAIIVAPIVSVLIAQKLQDWGKKRQDKMDIFMTLMTSRIYGWTPQSVNALNSIDIIFSDEPEVIKQWRNYYKALWVNNPDDKQKQTMIDEQESLLEIMAKSLGYKDSITLKTIIDNLIEQEYKANKISDVTYIRKKNKMQMQNQYKTNQLQAMELLISRLQNSSGENQNGQNENAVRKPNGRKHK